MDKAALLDQLSKLETLQSSLHSSFRFWEWMVVVGLGFDLLVILKEYWDDLKRFWRSEIHAPERPSAFLLLLALLGTGLIVYGISMELSVDSKLEKVETDTRRANDELFGMVSHEADAVTTETKDIEGRLTIASIDVGSLENRIASQGARGQILEDNKAAFINSLKRFAPQRIVVVNCGLPGAEGIEATGLEQNLMKFLGKNDGAGWAVEGPEYATWGECTQATVPTVTAGIVLVLSDTQDFPAKRSAVNSATALVNELGNKLKIGTMIAADTKLDNARILAAPGSFWKSAGDDPKAIYLLVGPNPQFTLTKPKKRSKG